MGHPSTEDRTETEVQSGTRRAPRRCSAAGVPTWAEQVPARGSGTGCPGRRVGSTVSSWVLLLGGLQGLLLLLRGAPQPKVPPSVVPLNKEGNQ